MSADRLYQRIDPAGVAAIPTATSSTPPPPPAPPSGRTWLEAATAIPEPAWWLRGRALPRARVYQTRVRGGPELGGPRWYWHCPTCDMGGGHNCLHDLIHPPGTWVSAMCGAFHHIHTRHPRPPADPGTPKHTTLCGRRRCDWSRPDDRAIHSAQQVLAGGIVSFLSDDANYQHAREILALAGIPTGDGPR